MRIKVKIMEVGGWGGDTIIKPIYLYIVKCLKFIREDGTQRSV